MITQDVREAKHGVSEMNNYNYIDELQVIVDDYDIDVASITETWFREYMDDTSLAL